VAAEAGSHGSARPAGRRRDPRSRSRCLCCFPVSYHLLWPWGFLPVAATRRARAADRSRAVSPACWYRNHGRAPGGASNPWNPGPGAQVCGRAAQRRAPLRPHCCGGPEPAQRIPDIRHHSTSASHGRRSRLGDRYPRAAGRPADQGTDQGLRVRMTSAARDGGTRTHALPAITGPGACRQ
jgi:hypothetical protein